MLVKTYCAAVNGLDVTTVTIEVSMTRGVMYHITGLPDNSVKESRDRISAAVQNIGFKFPVADITVNMAPADIRKEGSSYDLPLAIAILAANGKVQSDHLNEYVMVGELGLDGKVVHCPSPYEPVLRSSRDSLCHRRTSGKPPW